MRYRHLTDPEIGSLHFGKWINVPLLDGKIISRRFHSFAYGGPHGDTFALYINDEKEGPYGLSLRGVEVDRILGLEVEHADLYTDLSGYDD